MNVLISAWKTVMAVGLWALDRQNLAGPDAALGLISSENPPNPTLGDRAFPLFPFAKLLRKGPPQLAQGVVAQVSGPGAGARLAETLASLGDGPWEACATELAHGPWASPGTATASTALAPLLAALDRGDLGTIEAAGPYVNVRFNRAWASGQVLARVDAAGDTWGQGRSLEGRRVLVEFSSPNTNKPLHLGHLRNNTLGEATARIFRANGAEVRTVNLFNDRGIHICKSMLAYQRWGGGVDPAAQGLKPDHFVAQMYVSFQNELKKQIKAVRDANPALAAQDDDELWLRTEIGAAAQAMLVAWEEGDVGVRTLWEKMNGWAVGGIMQTYRRTGIEFDWIQYEHDTYMLGKAEVEKGLAQGAFFRRPDGAIAVELPWKDSAKEDQLAQKVVLRADGTSIYLTQDLGTAIRRHEEWPFDQAVYTVASEQDYHFKVLFHCLKVLGHPWADRLHHLSYGLVNLPTGRMKTREGTVVDADLLIDELRDLALEAIKEKNREEAVGDPVAIAEKVALAALHYYLIQTSPAKDMIFNPEESLAFSGNTGPYLQYMGARVSSMVRKWSGPLPALGDFDASKLTSDQEWDLLSLINAWPGVVADAARTYNPSLVATALYDLAKAFSRLYHDLPIINAEDPDLARGRLFLSAQVLKTLRFGMGLLNLPFLDVM